MKRKTIQITIEAEFVEFEYLCDKLIVDGKEYNSKGELLTISEAIDLINLGQMISKLPDKIRLINEKHFSQHHLPPKKSISNDYYYLMIDENSGFYKLGKSKDPEYRERTLQSEKPSITLLHKWKHDFYTERYLHSCYKSKRVRGEWFKLNNEDVSFIISIKCTGGLKCQ